MPERPSSRPAPALLASVEIHGCLVALAPVISSNILGVGYARETQVLVVQFTTGGVYAYHRVTVGKHADFLAAKSKGQWLHQHLVGKIMYPCERIL
jgi:hypothetical protein